MGNTCLQWKLRCAIIWPQIQDTVNREIFGGGLFETIKYVLVMHYAMMIFVLFNISEEQFLFWVTLGSYFPFSVRESCSSYTVFPQLCCGCFPCSEENFLFWVTIRSNLSLIIIVHLLRHHKQLRPLLSLGFMLQKFTPALLDAGSL